MNCKKIRARVHVCWGEKRERDKTPSPMLEEKKAFFTFSWRERTKNIKLPPPPIPPSFPIPLSFPWGGEGEGEGGGPRILATNCKKCVYFIRCQSTFIKAADEIRNLSFSYAVLTSEGNRCPLSFGWEMGKKRLKIIPLSTISHTKLKGCVCVCVCALLCDICIKERVFFPIKISILEAFSWNAFG